MTKQRRRAGKVALPDFDVDQARLAAALTAAVRARVFEEQLCASRRSGLASLPESARSCRREAVQIALATTFQVEEDVAFLSRRGLAFVMTRAERAGAPGDVLASWLQAVGTGPRTMWRWQHDRLLPEAGLEYGAALHAATAHASWLRRTEHDGVIWLLAGDGIAALGEFHECLNRLCRERLPMVLVVENNEFAWNRPLRRVIGARSVYELTAGFLHLQRLRCDGTHYVSTQATMDHARRLATVQKTPVLLVADVPGPDDELESMQNQTRDPVLLLEQALRDTGVDDSVIEQLKETAVERAESLLSTVLLGENTPPAIVAQTPTSAATGYPATTRARLIEALVERSRRLYVRSTTGEQGGSVSDAEGDGAAERVVALPVRTRALLQTAVGELLCGYEVMVEAVVQTPQELAEALQTFRLAAELHSHGHAGRAAFWCRMASAEIQDPAVTIGFSLDHVLTPGQIHLPATPRATEEVLLAWLREDIVAACVLDACRPGWAELDLAQKRQVPPGQARIVRAGTDLTLIGLGPAIVPATLAGERLAEKGISIEIIDAAILEPMDSNTFDASIQKTGRVAILYTEPLLHGIAQAMATKIQKRWFSCLDAPVVEMGVAGGAAPTAPETVAARIVESVKEALSY